MASFVSGLEGSRGGVFVTPEGGLLSHATKSPATKPKKVIVYDPSARDNWATRMSPVRTQEYFKIYNKQENTVSVDRYYKTEAEAMQEIERLKQKGYNVKPRTFVDCHKGHGYKILGEFTKDRAASTISLRMFGLTCVGMLLFTIPVLKTYEIPINRWLAVHKKAFIYVYNAEESYKQIAKNLKKIKSIDVSQRETWANYWNTHSIAVITHKGSSFLPVFHSEFGGFSCEGFSCLLFWPEHAKKGEKVTPKEHTLELSIQQSPTTGEFLTSQELFRRGKEICAAHKKKQKV